MNEKKGKKRAQKLCGGPIDTYIGCIIRSTKCGGMKWGEYREWYTAAHKGKRYFLRQNGDKWELSVFEVPNFDTCIDKKWDSGNGPIRELYDEVRTADAHYGNFYIRKIQRRIQKGKMKWSVHKEEDGIVQEYVSGLYHLSRTAEGNYKLVHSQAFAPGQQAIKQINADQMTLRNLYEQAGRPIKRKEEHRVSISLHMDRSEYYKGAKESEPKETRGTPGAPAQGTFLQNVPQSVTSPPAMSSPPHAAGTKTPVPPATAERSPAPPKESPAVPKTIPAARTMAETKPPVPAAPKPKPKSKPEPAKKAPKRIGLHDFVVRRSVFRCMHEGHHLTNIEAVFEVITPRSEVQEAVVTAGYCPQCRQYFLLESAYEKLRTRGIPLCKISDEKSYGRNHGKNRGKLTSADGMQLASESILMQYGYNVSQTEDLRAPVRQALLALLIDNRILTKNEVVSYLDFFIRQRRGQSKFAIAVSKWEEDREFVYGYRAGTFTKRRAHEIRRPASVR